MISEKGVEQALRSAVGIKFMLDDFESCTIVDVCGVSIISTGHVSLQQLVKYDSNHDRTKASCLKSNRSC